MVGNKNHCVRVGNLEKGRFSVTSEFWHAHCYSVNNTAIALLLEGNHTMYDRSFFQSKVGQAAIASVAAMVAFVALSTQMQMAPDMVAALPSTIMIAEIA